MPINPAFWYSVIRIGIWKYANSKTDIELHGVEISGFSVTEILCEINYEESRSSKMPVFCELVALNLVHLVDFSLQKGQKIITVKIQSL